MLASRASSSPSSTKPPVNRSPASSSLCTCHWSTANEFPLDVWSLHRLFSSCSSFSPLPANDSSTPLVRCRSPIPFNETDETDDHSTGITAFDLPTSLAATESSLATSSACRIPSSAFVFHQRRLRALPVSAQPPTSQDQQLHDEDNDDGFGLDLYLNPNPTLTHVGVRRTSPYLPSAVVLAAVPTTCFRRIPYSPDLFPPTPYRPPSAYPRTGSSSDPAAIAAAALNPQNQPSRNLDSHQISTFRPSPFRPQKAAGAAHRPRRLSAARLWNPTNSTPRPYTKPAPSRKRRPSTPPPPSIPLLHPTLGKSRAHPDPIGAGPSDYPLLTLSEQHQIRHSVSPRVSLQVDRAGSSDRRISLPNSVRASYDEKGSRRGAVSAEPRLSRDFLRDSVLEDPVINLDKGKGKAVMMPETEEHMPSYGKDLERGPDIMDPRISNVSAGDGIGSALSTTDSSIMGEEVEPDAAGEWGPQHPCYPHFNPHVPVDSPDYTNTRIIRIRRDWMVKGDLAPTFSNLYPEILEPAGLSEQEFRRIIEKLNGVLVPAFNPYSMRNIADSLLGLVTGWVWDDFGLTGIKSRLNGLEKWLEQWNMEMEKTMGSEDGAMAPKILPLRQTGYMTLDIQILDPEIVPAPSTTNPNDSATALHMEPASAAVS